MATEHNTIMDRGGKVMTPPPYDARVLSRVMSGQPVNGELAGMSEAFRPLAEKLLGLPAGERSAALEWALMMHPNKDAIEAAIINADPLGLPPQNAVARFATAADVRAVQTAAGSTWEGFIPSAKIVGIAGAEGTGKTRFGLDLCRRVCHGAPSTWPDGQAITLPPKTPSLWLCADGHHDEITSTMADFGLPDEAVVFPAPPDDPFANVSLDDDDTWKWIEDAVATVRPWCLFIDTLTYATSRDLCEQGVIAKLKTPLVNLVQTYSVNVAMLLHLSKEGQALGRRIKGITRTLIHLEAPDPDRPERLRLWVEKTSSKRPPPLGVTITRTGNEYDTNPPAPREASRGGRPPEKLDKAIEFLEAELSKGDRKGCELISEWEALGENKTTIFNAKRKLVTDGRVVEDDSKKPKIWHLVKGSSQGQEPSF
jgi:hypothetical protein